MLQSRAESITANYEPKEGVGSGEPQSLQDTIIRIVDLQREIQELRDELTVRSAQVEAVLTLVENPNQQWVLHLRYIRFKSGEEIEAETALQGEMLKKTHRRAIATVDWLLHKC